mmetsp:Transcript_112836/g.319180  ORF Transcript_112836/g.319180 Transcript_112836/m.319180 type:complete len:183 (+) Transcript_112836:68-616(+)
MAMSQGSVSPRIPLCAVLCFENCAPGGQLRNAARSICLGLGMEIVEIDSGWKLLESHVHCPKPYLILASWRQVKPCAAVCATTSHDLQPEVLGVVCEDERRFIRARGWAAEETSATSIVPCRNLLSVWMLLRERQRLRPEPEDREEEEEEAKWHEETTSHDAPVPLETSLPFPRFLYMRLTF